MERSFAYKGEKYFMNYACDVCTKGVIHATVNPLFYEVFFYNIVFISAMNQWKTFKTFMCILCYDK